MPELKDLKCSIEYGPHKTALREYGTTYKDGYVEAHVAVPHDKQPFEIHLTSKTYIAPGLAVFVYIDGVAQCNRNKRGLVKPTQEVEDQKFLADFRLRQKEDKIGNDRWLARAWTFEKLQTVTDEDATSEIESRFEPIGTIEVVVLRCQDRTSSVGKDKSQTSTQKAKTVPPGPMIQVPLPYFGFDGADERRMDRQYDVSETSSVSAPYDGPSGRRRYSRYPQPWPAYPPHGPPGDSPEPRHSHPSAWRPHYTFHPDSGPYEASHPREHLEQAYQPPLFPNGYDPHAGRGPSPPLSSYGNSESVQSYEAHHRRQNERDNIAANLEHRIRYPPPIAPHPYLGDSYQYNIPFANQYPPYWVPAPAPTPPTIISANRGTYSPRSGAKYVHNKDSGSATSKRSKKSNTEKKEKGSGNSCNAGSPTNADDWGKQDNPVGGDSGNDAWDASDNKNKNQADVSNDWAANTETAKNDAVAWGASNDNSNGNAAGWRANNEKENAAGWGANDNVAGKDGAWNNNEQSKPAGDSAWDNNAPGLQEHANHAGGNDTWNSNNDGLVGNTDGWAPNVPSKVGGDGWASSDQNNVVVEDTNWGLKPDATRDRSRERKPKTVEKDKKDNKSAKVEAPVDPDRPYLKPYFSIDTRSKASDGLEYPKPTDLVPPEPLLNVPSQVAEKTGATHQVRFGSAFLYNHYVGRPEYIDSMSRPYALFCFKYRSQEKLGEIFPDLEKDGKIKKERGDWKKRMMDMEKEDLLTLLRKAKSAAGYNTDSSLESTDNENGSNPSKEGNKTEKRLDEPKEKKEKKSKSGGSAW